MPESAVKGLILIGGQSSRMGTDKALVKWQGKTLLERAINTIAEVTEDIYLSVNTEQFEALRNNYQCILDKHADRGPLGGIYSALEELKTSLIVLAVDMPKLNKETIDALTNQSNATHLITCYQLNDRIQPFPSYWSIRSLQQVESSLKNNHLSVVKLINQLKPNLLSIEGGQAFDNLNSPSDLS